ncbi:E3 SUMO-protein ligase ZBED1-like [Eleginops maclovinus]|uniref:E3 SUMO-protein ligase ZBED1-like n=1 Tax=Eleginops maclovinus TaxID=56733 RepID=UPI0030810C96
MLVCATHARVPPYGRPCFFSSRTQQEAALLLSFNKHYREMAACASDTVAAGPRLVDKDDARSEIWRYFAYLADSEGKATDMSRPVCRKCYKQLQTKGANTSNLAKHLADKHAELHKEFKDRQRSAAMGSGRATPQRQQPTQQPTLQAMFEQHNKYPRESKEVKRLNRAVAEFICLDQVPVYIVEKAGFRNLMQNLDKRYDVPSRNFFMYNEIPKMYNETRAIISAQLSHTPNTFFSCTTDLWTSRTVDTYMAVTLQFITQSWEMQSWCLGCSALYSDHTADTLKETLEEIITDSWGLDMANMAGMTTDNASNNRKAFSEYTWIPCFGHNLHLAVNKAIDIDRVASCLSRLRKTVSGFSRSNKMSRLFKDKQKSLKLPQHTLIHDEPTRWGSTYDMVERFCEQQQAVSAVLAEDRKKWHLMPRDTDMTTIEIVRDVLAPLSDFTDALSGEKETTISSVLPLMWKIKACLIEEEGDRPLAIEMKNKIRGDFEKRYNDHNLQMTLNTSTFLDPRFKDTFVTMEEDIKRELLLKSEAVQLPPHSPVDPRGTGAAPKRNKRDLKSLLCTITTEKKGADNSETRHHSPTPATPTDRRLNVEFLEYKQLREISPAEDPLAWWSQHEAQLPILAHFAKNYLCIAASSCASERVFSTSGNICSPRRSRLTEEHLDMLVFLAKNLNKCKK